MLLYLYGLDSYRRNARLAHILAEFKKRYPDGTIDRFDGAEKDVLDRLISFIKDQSLFAKAKIATIENVDETNGAGKILKSILEDKNITLVVVTDKKLSKEFAFLGKKPSHAEEFETLAPATELTFIKKEVATRGLKINDEDIRSVVSAYGSDTWGILNELEKINLGGAPEARVAEPQFFALVQTLKNPSVVARLSALAYLLENEEPAAVFNVFASIASPELKIKMADYDVAIKSGKLEYEEALLDLAISK